MYGKLMYLLYNWKIRELIFFFTSNLVRDNFKKIDEGKKIVDDVYSSKTTYKN